MNQYEAEPQSLPRGSRRCDGRGRIAASARAMIAPLVLLVVAAVTAPGVARAERLAIEASPLLLDLEVVQPARFGRLIWRGGIELDANDRRFGGFSGLDISPDGRTMTAISDRGAWVTAYLMYDTAGQLNDAAGIGIGWLRGRNGAALSRKGRDAESLARLDDGSYVVGFEHIHRVWRYPPSAEPFAGNPTPMPSPPGLDAAGANSGLEGLATVGSDSLFAVVEGSTRKDQSPAYLWRGGAWSPLIYERSDGFRPTGATRLPDGDLLVLERRLGSPLPVISARLRRLPVVTLIPGANLQNEVLALLEAPLPVDNFEGVAARQDDSGRTFVYLISDDNFNPLQRTLLVMFELVD